MYNLMLECNNYFDTFAIKGTFNIVDNEIELQSNIEKFNEGDYIRFITSLFNKQIYKITKIESNKITCEGLRNEIIEGYLLYCVVPQEFVALAKDYSKNVSSESVQGYYSATYKDLTNKVNTYKKPFIGRTYILKEIPIFDNIQS